MLVPYMVNIKTGDQFITLSRNRNLWCIYNGEMVYINKTNLGINLIETAINRSIEVYAEAHTEDLFFIIDGDIDFDIEDYKEFLKWYEGIGV